MVDLELQHRPLVHKVLEHLFCSVSKCRAKLKGQSFTGVRAREVEPRVDNESKKYTKKNCEKLLYMLGLMGLYLFYLH